MSELKGSISKSEESSFFPTSINNYFSMATNQRSTDVVNRTETTEALNFPPKFLLRRPVSSSKIVSNGTPESPTDISEETVLVQNVAQDFNGSATYQPFVDKTTSGPTLEEREQAYEEARRRIFGHSKKTESSSITSNANENSYIYSSYLQPRLTRARPFRQPVNLSGIRTSRFSFSNEATLQDQKTKFPFLGPVYQVTSEPVYSSRFHSRSSANAVSYNSMNDCKQYERFPGTYPYENCFYSSTPLVHPMNKTSHGDPLTAFSCSPTNQDSQKKNIYSDCVLKNLNKKPTHDSTCQTYDSEFPPL